MKDKYNDRERVSDRETLNVMNEFLLAAPGGEEYDRLVKRLEDVGIIANPGTKAAIISGKVVAVLGDLLMALRADDELEAPNTSWSIGLEDSSLVEEARETYEQAFNYLLGKPLEAGRKENKK